MDQQGGQTIDKNWNMCDMALNLVITLNKLFFRDANMYNLSRYVFKGQSFCHKLNLPNPDIAAT